MTPTEDENDFSERDMPGLRGGLNHFRASSSRTYKLHSNKTLKTTRMVFNWTH